MIKNICRDVLLLSRRSVPATAEDLETARDLKDTLAFHRAGCVGMAANMIGVSKNIIIIDMGMKQLVMFNPVIVSRNGKYETEEGCLSLSGTRKTTRYRNIEVEYQDESMKKIKAKYSGFTAQIIQHEIDHLEGIII